MAFLLSSPDRTLYSGAYSTVGICMPSPNLFFCITACTSSVERRFRLLSAVLIPVHLAPHCWPLYIRYIDKDGAFALICMSCHLLGTEASCGMLFIRESPSKILFPLPLFKRAIQKLTKKLWGILYNSTKNSPDILSEKKLEFRLFIR